ncbi:MAG: hypothetical protein E6G76_00480, partial [Alphaproteobacteria bacterium]
MRAQAELRSPVGSRVEQRLAAGARGSHHLFRRATGHCGREIVCGESAASGERGHSSVAQHGAAVGDRRYLVEAMGNIDDGRALALHPREHRKKPGDFALLQRRGRLVENEDAAAPAQPLGDGHELTFRKTERGDR